MPEASQLVAGGRAERHHRLLGKRERIPEGNASIFFDPAGIGMVFYRLSGGMARSSLDHRLQALNPLGSGESDAILTSWREAVLFLFRERFFVQNELL